MSLQNAIMKLKLLKQLLESTPAGTYVGARLSDESAEKIMEFINANNFPDALGKKELHTTLIYSRKYLPKFKSRGKLETPMLAEPDKFGLFGEEENALVIKLKSPDLVERHNQIMDDHGATFDFDEYQPHITLSYECVGLDISKLNLEDIGPLELIEEYHEDLDGGWR